MWLHFSIRQCCCGVRTLHFFDIFLFLVFFTAFAICCLKVVEEEELELEELSAKEHCEITSHVTAQQKVYCIEVY